MHRRILDLARRKAIEPKLGTPLGILFVHEQITAIMYDAGDKFATLRRAADRVNLTPARTPAAINALASSPRRGKFVDDPDLDEAVLEAYCSARFALTVHQLRAVECIACDQHHLSDYRQRLDLFAGLRALAAHWQLT